MVKKVVAGTGADAATGYAIHLRCDIEGDITLEEDVVLTDGESSESFEVQTGSSCNATDEEGVVTITNTFRRRR